MVAYSFKAQFAQPIIDRTKGGTIRADRRRHARPGEELQLYTGMRTKQCRLISRETCLDALPIGLDFPNNAVILSIRQHALTGWKLLDAFALFDGFQNWLALREFWRKEHGSDLKLFNGVHIRWLDWPEVLR